MCIESVMPSNHLILCCPLLLPSIKRCLLQGRDAMTDLDRPRQRIKKQKHHFADKGLYSQSYVFSSSHVQMWKLDHREGWVPKNGCFHTVVLEKTLESPLDCKEIKPVNPKGNQSWIFIGRTDAEAPILWPSDSKRQLIGKDPDAGKDWGQEKGTTEDEMVRWHHWLNAHEFEQTLGDGEGQGSLACYSVWVTKSWAWLSSWTTMWLLFTTFILSVYITLSPNPNASFMILYTDWSFWSSIMLLGFYQKSSFDK